MMNWHFKSFAFGIEKVNVNMTDVFLTTETEHRVYKHSDVSVVSDMLQSTLM